MGTLVSRQAIDDLVEVLADIEHQRWSHWQRYMHKQCERQPDGSLTIPAGLVVQWERQSATSYPNLSDSEKNSDREQVMRYLPVVLDAFGIVADRETR